MAFFRQSGNIPVSKLQLMQFAITSPSSSIDSRMRFVGMPSGPMLDFFASFLLSVMISFLEVGNKNILSTEGVVR